MSFWMSSSSQERFGRFSPRRFLAGIQSAAFQRAAGGRVHVCAPGSLPYSFYGVLLTFQDRLIQPLSAAAGLPDEHRARHVRRVAREYSTKVEDNQFAGVHNLGGRARVG